MSGDIGYLIKHSEKILLNEISKKYISGISKLVAQLSFTQRASPPPFPLADSHLPFGSIAISAKNGLFFGSGNGKDLFKIVNEASFI